VLRDAGPSWPAAPLRHIIWGWPLDIHSALPFATRTSRRLCRAGFEHNRSSWLGRRRGLLTARVVDQALAGAELNLTVQLAVLYAVSLLVPVLHIFERRQSESIAQHYAADIRAQLLKKALQLPISRVRKQRRGAMMLRFVGDLSAIGTWVGNGLGRVISAVFFLPLILAAIAYLSPNLS
jgi:ABC-type multidrug transport system fused ATPase/permease subunit